MSKELTYYVTDETLEELIIDDRAGFNLTKSNLYKNEIKIIIPKKQVKKYIVLYEINGCFATTDSWGNKYFTDLEEFKAYSETMREYKPIQLILESEKLFEE